MKTLGSCSLSAEQCNQRPLCFATVRLGFWVRESNVNVSKRFQQNFILLESDTWQTQDVTRINLSLSSPVLLHMSGPTCIPVWVLWCWVSSRLLGASAGAGSSVYWGLRVSASLWAFFLLLSLIILLVKHQVHPRHGLPEDGGRASGWRQHRLLKRKRK